MTDAARWFLYLIECVDGSLYTGISTDVAARYAAHAAGRGARYTRSRPPERLLGWLPFPDRSTASKAEYALKRLSVGEKRAFARSMEQGLPPAGMPAGVRDSATPQMRAAGPGHAEDDALAARHEDAVLRISSRVSIPLTEIDMQAVRAQGAGGQNVNKVSSAIHLRFDIGRSTLPEQYRQRLCALQDSRITKEGVVVIKAQAQRSQERNRAEALERLQQLVRSVMLPIAVRKPTRVPAAARRRRLEEKRQRSATKAARGRPSEP